MTALAPEIWNFTVIVTICALLGWMARVVHMLLEFADLRTAVASSTVLHLKDLGTSLSVLRGASTWHLQQLARTNQEAKSTAMQRVFVTFDVVTSSIELKRERDQSVSALTGPSSPSTALSFAIRSQVPVTVQVFWNVRCEALDLMARSSGALSHTTTETQQVTRVPVLRSLSMDRTLRVLRSAPTRLSHIRRQRRRHELSDDASGEDAFDAPRAPEDPVALHSVDFVSHSDPIRLEQPATLAVPVPDSVFGYQPEELQSLIEEADSHEPTQPRPTRTTSEPPPPAPRYSALIKLSMTSSDNPQAVHHRMNIRRTPVLQDKGVSCVLVAVDFLPTPSKPERYNPVIVKKICYTDSDAFIAQDIFGVETEANSECTICLEGTRSVVLLPCRHLCVCQVCLEEIDRCPICRAKFATYVSVEQTDDARGVKC